MNNLPAVWSGNVCSHNSLFAFIADMVSLTHGGYSLASCTHTYTHSHIHTHTHTQMHEYAHIITCTHVNTHIVHVYIHVHVQTHRTVSN